jgi:hypothetical protein
MADTKTSSTKTVNVPLTDEQWRDFRIQAIRDDLTIGESVAKAIALYIETQAGKQ